MRLRAAVDRNQPDIVEFARKIGFSVAITSQLGKGFPDIVLGKLQQTFLAEIKDPKKFPSQRILTDDELIWHERWGGHVCVIETDEDVLRLDRLAKQRYTLIRAV